MRKILASVLGLLATLAICCGYTHSGSTYKTDGSQADVQAALNAASDGTTIQIPEGSFSWASGVSVTKGVTIQGQGTGKTKLVRNPLNGFEGGVYNSFKMCNVQLDNAKFRLTGVAFEGAPTLGFSGSPETAIFRVDNCSFNIGSIIQIIFVELWANPKGLIDHCSFNAGNASEMIHNMGYGGENDAGWRDDVHPGSDEALYVENCTFSKDPIQDAYFWGTAALQGYYGSRTVMRHNKLNASHIDQHGTPGAIGARWFEFYNNTFYVPAGMNQSDYIVLRGGSGVVFSNVLSGGNVVTGSIKLYDENGGSEPKYLGRGIDRNPSPIYIWANDQKMPVGSGSTNVIEGRDYYVSDQEPSAMKRWQLQSDNANSTYNYKPYVYPHPLDDGPPDSYVPGAGGGGGPGPSPTPTPTPQPSATPTPNPTATPAPSPTPIVIQVPYPSTITIEPKQ